MHNRSGSVWGGVRLAAALALVTLAGLAVSLTRAPQARAAGDCLSGYCITSVQPMGDGAIECHGQMTEVLQVTVKVGKNVGYAFPYVTAEVTNAENPNEWGSGFASVNQSGNGPDTLNFVMRIVIPGPGTYTGFASGEGAGLPPSFAPDFDFSFTTQGRSPVSTSAGDPTCQDQDPSLLSQIQTALYGAVEMGGYAGIAAEGLGGIAKTAYDLLGYYDSYSSKLSKLESLWSHDDPPDPNYTEIPTYTAAPTLTPPSGLTSDQSTAVSTSFGTYARAIGYLEAFTAAYERAWGAIDAGDSSSYVKQLTAAGGFATHAATELQALPDQMAAVQQAITPDPTGTTLTAAGLTSYQATVMGGQDPAGLVAGLQALGESAADAQADLLGTAAPDTSAYAGIDVGTVFTAVKGAETAEAATLSKFATWAASAVSTAPPTITAVTPAAGLTVGGDTVTVTGTNLQNVSTIQFGSEAAGTGLSCSATSCKVTTPRQAEGTVDVTAVNAGGPSGHSAADQFTFQTPQPPTVTSVSPASGYVMGGTKVTVAGTHLTRASEIDFGTGHRGTGLSCTDASCTVTDPAGSPGIVDVTVTTPGGTSATSTADQFTYVNPPQPAVTSVSPSSGYTVGGTVVTITGTNLSGETAVDFGAGHAARNVSCSDVKCTATSPAAGAGTVDVTVTTPGGTSAAASGDRFTYTVPPVPALMQVTPAGGPRTGGTHVTVMGANLDTVTEIDFGTGNPGSGLSCTATRCTVTAPPGTPGHVHVIAVDPGGASPGTAADAYTYDVLGVQELPLPKGATGGPGHVASGSGGTMWFTEPNTSRIGRVSPTGVVTELPTATASSYPVGIVRGPDGREWYAEQNPNDLVAVDASDSQTKYPIGSSGSQVLGLTVGPDGRLWFTEYGSGQIGAMTTSGTVTLYPQLANVFSQPRNIVAGPDGRLWFTEFSNHAIGAITTDGKVTEYPLPRASQPLDITAGPDGRLWFTDDIANAVGAMTTGGTVQYYPIPAAGATPTGITTGPDGRLWIAEMTTNQIASMTTSGDVTEYATPNADRPGYAGAMPSLNGSPAVIFTQNGVSPALGAVQPLPPVPAAPAFTSPPSATATAGQPSSFTVQTTGYPQPMLSESGALPGGMAFDPTTGVLSGTPAAGSGGIYRLTFTSHNGVGSDATQPFTLTVTDPSGTPPPGSGTPGNGGGSGGTPGPGPGGSGGGRSAPVVPAEAGHAAASGGATVRTRISTRAAGDLLLALVAAGGPAGARQMGSVSGGGLRWRLVRRTDAARGTAEVWAARAAGRLRNAVVTSVLHRRGGARQSLTIIAFAGATGVGATAGAHGSRGAGHAPLRTTGASSWVLGVGEAMARIGRLRPTHGQLFLSHSSRRHQSTWVEAGAAHSLPARSRITMGELSPLTGPWNLTLVEIR